MQKINKDFKKILILGIVSIVISGFALYSFKDIKFTNTHKLQKENAQKQKIQQNIEQEYQKLLNKTSDTASIHDINTSKLEKDKDIKTNITGTLSILIPKFFINSGFIKINEKLKEKEIIVDLDTIDNFSQYKKLILSSRLNNHDIYLLPSTRLKGLKLKTIDIGDNPKVYFHKTFNNLVSVNDNKYIPYSIDPIIILKKHNINIGSNRSDIFSYITLRGQQKKYTMPLIRGIGQTDIRLLEVGHESFQNYFDILYTHITQLKSENNTNTNIQNISELKNMFNTQNINLAYKYDFTRFKQLYQTINKRDTNCEIFPAICLMSYNLGDMKFGFVSDLDILDYYFAQNNNNFTIDNFSNTKTNYPVKGWIFVVPQNNQNINLANEFFKQYISIAIENNTGLRNNTLSAINNIYDIQKNSPIYKNIISNENNFKLIYQNINLQEKFIDNTINLNLLKGNYNIETYIK